MIYELRTYTMKPGMAAVHAESAGTIGREIRGDDYGVLIGHWLTEIGPLNQSMHLWAYEDLNDRAEKKASLARNKRWCTDYLPPVRAVMQRQDVRLMRPAKNAGGRRQYIRISQLSPQAWWLTWLERRFYQSSAGARKLLGDCRPLAQRCGPAE